MPISIWGKRLSICRTRDPIILILDLDNPVPERSWIGRSSWGGIPKSWSAAWIEKLQAGQAASFSDRGARQIGQCTLRVYWNNRLGANGGLPVRSV